MILTCYCARACCFNTQVVPLEGDDKTVKGVGLTGFNRILENSQYLGFGQPVLGPVPEESVQQSLSNSPSQELPPKHTDAIDIHHD